MPLWSSCICPAIQQSLNNIARKNAPSLMRDKVGTIEFLKSPLNTNGFEQLRVDPGTGKYKQVDVNYSQRKTEAYINTTCGDDCDSGPEPAPGCERVNVGNCYESRNLKFDEDNMRRICEPLGAVDEQWIASEIMSLMNAFLVTINKAVLTQINANFGTFLDGASIRDIQLFNSLNATYGNMDGARQFAISRIVDNFDESGFSGPPAVIGHGDLNLYYKALGIGCCNMMGADLSKLSGETNFFYDRFVQGQIGVNEFAVIAPGVVQLLEWDKYVGKYAKQTETFEHGTILDPFSGMTFDLKMHYDDCKDQYYIKLQKNWDIWFLPDDSHVESDELFGVNGVFNYRVCDALVDCEESESPSAQE